MTRPARGALHNGLTDAARWLSGLQNKRDEVASEMSVDIFASCTRAVSWTYKVSHRVKRHCFKHHRGFSVVEVCWFASPCRSFTVGKVRRSRPSARPQRAIVSDRLLGQSCVKSRPGGNDSTFHVHGKHLTSSYTLRATPSDYKTPDNKLSSDQQQFVVIITRYWVIIIFK